MTVAVIIAGLLPVLWGTGAGSGGDEPYCRADDWRHDYRAVAVAVHHSGSLQADVAAQAPSPCGITCVARLRRQTVGGFSLRLSSERADPFAVLAWCTTEFTDKRFVKRRFARITYRLGNHHHRQRFTRQGLGGDLQAQRC